MKRKIVSLGLVLFFAFPMDALARNTEHNLSVKDAVETGKGRENLLEVPFYMAGQQHPRVAKVLSEWSATRPTRAAFRSDEDSCKVAFLSAVIVLQERARAEGGDAVVEIISIADDKETKSASEYRCYAGAMVARVGLKGKVVKLAK